MQRPAYDAVVVGAGPNGLTAAALLATSGHSVLVREATRGIGGGARTEELTEPGFWHDVCSAIHPLAAASPGFAPLDLRAHGLELAHPAIAAAHPLPDGTAGVLDNRSFAATVASLGDDGPRWQRQLGPYARGWGDLVEDIAGPVVHVPHHPVKFVRFGLAGMPSAAQYAKARLRDERARALFLGLAAHSTVRLTHPLTASYGVMMGASAHAVGWPAIRGGSQKLADVLARIVRDNGGEIETGAPVHSLAELPPARVVFLDTSPFAALEIGGDRLSPRVRRGLAKFRQGVAAFKLDYALSDPVPWTNAECRRAGTLHVCGTAAEVIRAEDEVSRGKHPERPFVLVAQQSLFDPTRAPAGKHTLWAYCHVPNGSTVDMTERVEAQFDRFAPGWRDVVLARNVITPAAFENRNPSRTGGDFSGGSLSGVQFVSRPRLTLDPYRLADGLYLCSASTPPGPGVHGMCARAAVERARKRELRG
jgi:phytoene dehydrogenase-like protein